MIFHTNRINGAQERYSQPEFQVQSSAVIVNCLFFASLSASLLAALASVIALQWVADYDAAITRGGSSPEDRAKRRQFRYAGVIQWKMSEIIAALPILLYASVILFFTGLILWMYTVHPTVANVVAGGAAIAVIFYVTTTVIAAVSVSAPFKTPLSRWLYALSRLPLSALYILAKRIRTSKIPAWLKDQHNFYTNSHKREHRAVESRDELAQDALVWLATQLSVSQDSYRRLLLLVGELPTIEPKFKLSFDSAQAIWYSIFDLLAWRSLTKAREEALTAEDTHAMAILLRCHSIPGVQELVAPKERTQYIIDKKEPTYWTQHCDLSQSYISNTSPDSPNHLFLMLRDVPATEDPSNQEAATAVLLSRWRNTNPSSPHIWKGIFNHAEEFSCSFFNSSIMTFSAFTTRYAFTIRYGRSSVKKGEWDSVDELLISVIHEITRVATRRLDVDADATVALVHAYEAVLSLAIEFDSMWPLIRSPHTYISNFGWRPARDHTLHESFIVLLARQIRCYPLSQRPQRVWEVIMMLWLRQSNPAPRKRFGNADEPLQSSTVTDWIQYADRIPNIIEILQQLSMAQAEQPDEIGPLWRATNWEEDENDPHFTDAVCSFDRLMGLNCSPEDHLTMVNIVCQDLELEQKPEFEEYFTAYRVYEVTRINDYCLRALSYHAQGLDYEELVHLNPEYSQRWKASVERVKEHVRKMERAKYRPGPTRRTWISLSASPYMASASLKLPSDTRSSL